MEKRRLKAAKLFEDGLTDSEVGRRLKAHRSSVGAWRRRWEEEGRSGLKAAGRAGRQSRLNDKQRSDVVEALENGARANGFASDVWTLPRVTELVKRVTGVQYHPRYMGEILRALGWSCQRPSMKAKERNEKAIANWRRHTWPAIKKKPKKSGES